MEQDVENKIIKAIKTMAGVLDEHLCSTRRAYELASSIYELSAILKVEYDARLDSL